MNATAIQAILQIIEGVLPEVQASTSLQSIIGGLEQIIPIVIAEAKQLLAPVQNILSALSSKGGLTPEQIAAVQALNAQVDAAFVAADEAYQAAHPDPAV